MTTAHADLPMSFTYADARRLGLSDRRLHGLVADGAIYRLGRGVYRRSDAPLADDDLIEVAAKAPDATLALLSAAHRHDLTDRIPTRLDLALPRSQRAPRVHAAVRWHRFDETTWQVGRGLLDVGDGLAIGLYDAERTLVDLFRLRHLEGDDVAVEALKRWLRRPGSVPATLLGVARRFPSAEPSLRAALQVLL
jgi:predicted transcriptional regulator of viral defense system